MTHPPAGPSTPPPPSGPRFVPNDPADMRKLAAELAGARGRSAWPLDGGQRIDNYWHQNGVARLTPRQRRRADHKAAGHFYRQPA